MSGNEAPPGEKNPGKDFCHITLSIFVMMKGIFHHHK